MKKVLLTALVLSASFGCSEKKDKKATVGTKMRTTGVSDSLMTLLGGRMASLAGQAGVATSSIALDSLKVPITRVNLVSDLKGSGYTGTSPNFYTCPAESDCLVELTDDSLDNLLVNSGAGEIKVDGDTTYNGTAVEFCKEGQGGEGNTFDVVVKGKLTLGATEYHTNATSGLSTTGPAEAVALPVTCHGFTTPLPQPVTLGPDKNVNIVLWADPNGMVVAAEQAKHVNGYCKGDGPEICTGFTALFTTVDDGKPTIERYLWDVQTEFDGKPYADMMMTVLFNSNDDPVGASMTQIYTNKEEVVSMHSTPISFSRVEKMGDGTLNFKMWKGEGETMEQADALSTFPRENATGLKISELVSEELTFNSTKL